MTIATESLDPHRCVVVVVDLQNDYCHPEGAMARMGNDVSAAADVAATAVELLQLARTNDVPCVIVRTTHGPWTNTPGWLSRGTSGDVLAVERIPLCVDGTWGAELYEIEPAPGDLVVTKHRYSGFAYTPLELAFRSRGRDVGVYAGTMTDACVEATALDGLMRGVHAALVSDASATSSPAAQAAAEAKFRSLIGQVVTLDELRARWALAST